MQWFAAPQPTKERAQALHKPDVFFDPAAVFKSPDGFVLARLRLVGASPPRRVAKNIETRTGYKMVSYCAPLLHMWKDCETGATP